jgi:hypothetical protein
MANPLLSHCRRLSSRGPTIELHDAKVGAADQSCIESVPPWLRRLDHAGIFGMIAGSYTPFGLLVLDGAWRTTVLAIVWSGALAAIVLKFVWVGAPKWLGALLGVTLGWVGVVVFPQLLRRTGPTASMLVLAGGLCYTLGALVYALRKPDPRPATFGYHEPAPAAATRPATRPAAHRRRHPLQPQLARSPIQHRRDRRPAHADRHQPNSRHPYRRLP